ncbi:thermonuclease family protein [Serratia sp. (in: enterobacteria)]|uniref:thermonuclease family protein n=1 Tax=Serratia sp. (in: enterobacteria) TaxID=616 RepID=UPI00398A36D7
MKIILSLISLIFLISIPIASADIVGKVTYVVDGDTVDINQTRIRFSLVDTPERGEAGYKEAKDFVKSLCLGKSAYVNLDDEQPRKSFGRVIGVITCDNRNVNEMLIINNLAKIRTEYCSVSEFYDESWANPCQECKRK